MEIYTWKEPDEDGGEWGASTMKMGFENISGFSKTELGAVKEFFTAMIAVIEIMEEDTDLNKFDEIRN